MLQHKDWILPEVSLTHDEADPRWAGEDAIPIDGGKYYEWIRPPGIHANWWEVVNEQWGRSVLDYEATPDSIYYAYHYLDNHPVFWKFSSRPEDERPPNHVAFLVEGGAFARGCLEIIPHMICPETQAISNDPARNTKLEFWYEFGPVDLLPDERGHNSTWHDYLLDGGGATWEQCILDIARKVWTHYGNDRRIVDTEEWRDGSRSYGEDA